MKKSVPKMQALAVPALLGGLLWQSQMCAATAGQFMVQAARTGQACQQWDFTVGDGEYRITSAWAP